MLYPHNGKLGKSYNYWCRKVILKLSKNSLHQN